MVQKISWESFLADAFCEGLRIILFILSARVLEKISMDSFLADASCEKQTIFNIFCLAGWCKRSPGRVFWQMHSVKD